MPSARPSTARRLLGLIIPLALLLLAVWVFFHRQFLQDRYILWNYKPSAEITALAEGAALSSHGTDLFYVNLPELHGKETFSHVCSGLGDEKSNVLGCFNGSRIYIFDVEDERLRGVREVTAAHEMLHAAYLRLGNDEKNRVNDLLEKQLRTGVLPHITELITIYKRLEPGQLLNEMHSILATEQTELIPELEQYFAQYFTQRSTVVGLSDAYRAVFDSLRTQQLALAAELDKFAEQINNGTAVLNQRIADFNTQVAAFNQRTGGGAMTQEEFNNERAAILAERDKIEAESNANTSLRQIYDTKRQQFESLNIEFTQLQKTIDSRPTATESVE